MRLKKQPNLRQKYRELIVRTNAIGIAADLRRGYLYYTDPISNYANTEEYQIWASESNLNQFKTFVEHAERIAKERPQVIHALQGYKDVMDLVGVTIEPINSDDWWLEFKSGQESGHLPLLKSSLQTLYMLAGHPYRSHT